MGHVGCSLGYSLDSYRLSIDLTGINSPVNEQANAGLQRIRGQSVFGHYVYKLLSSCALRIRGRK